MKIIEYNDISYVIGENANDNWYILTKPNKKANNFTSPLFCIVN